MHQSKIRQLRISRAWSQEQLAELSSLSVRTVQRIENGEQASLETLGAIAAAFDIKVSELTENDVQTGSSPGQALDEQIEKARYQVVEESGFYRSVLLWAVINAGLFALNHYTSPDSNWFVWPLCIWGGILLLRGLRIFVFRGTLERWQKARLQKLIRKP
ncbi:2TM domain-containing protein [Rahnella sp. C60]|jgi:transcriptional regulator with XRE-family HTH domain|uniref:2TM domain-containing protein n=1 Tax=Rahnella perminowiae TaxID=2816244 RepID=A0ABS6KXX0_9GAMM|nr:MULTISPECIES: 2TM domain-containing protein [Rahnella]UJD88242.1 helix-turn-helix domain-containing protein [Rahnella aquatilis]MBU9812760.1 2TM domain-containing protein [Rahnella perminowiae]MBU9816347.1 2TM domain-containing protein [Rahnella perminowiae]MBU9826521.1 2TM domain-containing protein [Rahnella perminowiae]MBU9834443.1 2TM domain-containing protein [Rahnella perminowiae]